MKKTVKNYYIHRIAECLNRDKMTIIRWEKRGFIPKAKRCKKGWRYYTFEEVINIIDLAKKSNNFKEKMLWGKKKS